MQLSVTFFININQKFKPKIDGALILVIYHSGGEHITHLHITDIVTSETDITDT